MVKKSDPMDLSIFFTMFRFDMYMYSIHMPRCNSFGRGESGYGGVYENVFTFLPNGRVWKNVECIRRVSHPIRQQRSIFRACNCGGGKIVTPCVGFRNTIDPMRSSTI